MTHPGRRLVIAGGSGFLGRSLAAWMAGRGWEVTVLSRHPPREPGPWSHEVWSAGVAGAWVERLDGAAAVVNLAGRTVDCVKTPDHQDEIVRSRVESTLALGRAMRAIKSPPRVWVQMSTAHIYGDPPEARITEGSAFGVGLAPTVGRAWEEAFAQSVLPAQRAVVLRTSFVLGRGGGALRRLALLARLGLGGRVGHGRQGMSWIHGRDMDRIFERAITDDGMRGAYIASAPNPVSQAEFMRRLRRALRVPIGLPAPGPLVRLGAPLVMRTDPDLALYGRYCLPERLLGEGFGFEFAELGPALADVCA
ncbi:MAG: TIGR01777 family oxidoreductase [Phycisphaerales bacterium]|nr:TIGR01777 family oxidoreductase [Phycisphaerales bacterium]